MTREWVEIFGGRRKAEGGRRKAEELIMMKFEKLVVWQVSFRLTEEVYAITRNCRDYSFCDQIRRSALSVPSNIAEGTERGSDKDSVRFLYYAKGSVGELLTQIKLGIKFGYVEQEVGNSLVNECYQISKMLAGLIKHRKG